MLQLLAPVAEYGIPPRSLMMEITESVAIDEPVKVLEILDILHGKGIDISIDDFGTGYSSLSYLQKFPACELKIDQSFVRAAPGDTAAMELIRAMVAMGHALGMSVVAEGVEDEATAKLMEKTGCDVLQGYLFFPPLPASRIGAIYLAEPACMPGTF